MAAVVLAALASATLAAEAADQKIPITTSSEEARQLYLKGRDLAEKLRATDARVLYAQAAAKDSGFALAQLGLANTAGTAKEFFDALAQFYRRGYLRWIDGTTRRPEVRRERIARMVELLESGVKDYRSS